MEIPRRGFRFRGASLLPSVENNLVEGVNKNLLAWNLRASPVDNRKKRLIFGLFGCSKVTDPDNYLKMVHDTLTSLTPIVFVIVWDVASIILGLFVGITGSGSSSLDTACVVTSIVATVLFILSLIFPDEGVLSPATCLCPVSTNLSAPGLFLFILLICEQVCVFD